MLEVEEFGQHVIHHGFNRRPATIRLDKPQNLYTLRRESRRLRERLTVFPITAGLVETLIP